MATATLETRTGEIDMAETHARALKQKIALFNRPDRDGEAVYAQIRDYVRGGMGECSSEVRQAVLAGIHRSLTTLTKKEGDKLELNTLAELEEMILGNN